MSGIGLDYSPHQSYEISSVVVVAKEAERVIATLTLVMDNTLLGLPMEQVYGPEVAALRTQGRRLIEQSDDGKAAFPNDDGAARDKTIHQQVR